WIRSLERVTLRSSASRNAFTLLSERPAEALRDEARAPAERFAAGRFAAGRFAAVRRLGAPAEAEARLAFGLGFACDRLREPPVDLEPPDFAAMDTPHLGGQADYFMPGAPRGW